MAKAEYVKMFLLLDETQTTGPVIEIDITGPHVIFVAQSIAKIELQILNPAAKTETWTKIHEFADAEAAEQIYLIRGNSIRATTSSAGARIALDRP